MKFLIPLLAAVSAFTVMTPASVEAHERCSSGHHRSHSGSYRSHSYYGGYNQSYSRSYYGGPSGYNGGGYNGARPYRCEPYIRPYCPPPPRCEPYVRPSCDYYGGYNGGYYGGQGFGFYYSR